MLKVVVFDFDGVIVDSNRIKEDAFYRLFEGHPHISRELVADVLMRNVGTRFDILRDIFVRSGAQPDEITRLVDESAARFDAMVQERIATRGLAPGARETLEDLSKNICLYINSATPETALKATVEHLGIQGHFRAVHGAPPTKEENLRAIMAREGVEAGEVVVVGDGEGDMLSATACGTHFIAIDSGFYPWGENPAFPVVPSIQAA
ncbi:MAG: HAD family hydrolase, partial [Candidatus Sungbacteria bacterium]|nr:HAD family hydrolase [Candidatus Sungbacteria bacterium]